MLRARTSRRAKTLRDWLIDDVAPQFPELQLRVTRLENGPPVGYPVQFRVSGEHIDRVRAHRQAGRRRRCARIRNVANVNLDWDEPSKVVRLEIDQDRARALGVSSAQLAQFLSGSLSGLHVSTYREGNELVEMLLRGTGRRAHAPGPARQPGGADRERRSVPLSQIATLEYGFEDGIIWHRNRLPTVTVRADIRDELTPPTVVAQILPTLETIRAELPEGYLLRDRRHGRGFRARAELDQRRHAAVPAGGDHAADAAAAQLLAHDAWCC